MASVPTLPQTPKNSKVQILPADASNLKTAYTGAASGSKITGCVATSTDTAARDVTIGVSNGGTFYPLGTVTVPIGAGTVAGTPGVNLFDPLVIKGLPVDNDGQPYIFLVNGDTLQVKALTTVTAAKEIDVIAIGADF